ncbi:cytochrome P450 [Mycena capillaripes]|nr:cytochrome P450 [Mycena capillaripes]
MLSSMQTAILVATFVSIGFLLSKSSRRLKSNLPPGPRRWPLIGSVLEMPQSHQWVTFSQWAKTYGASNIRIYSVGSIVYLDVLGQPVIVINSAKVAKDLLDQRFLIYSDRPNLNLFVLQPYNDIWQQQRKIVAQDFGPSAVRRYYALQEAEAQKLVHGLVEDPSTLVHQTQLRIGTIIIRVTYGHYITDEHDRFLTSPLTATDNFSQATAPGVWAVDLFNCLKSVKHLPSWIPGSVFLQVAKRWRKIKNLNTSSVLTFFLAIMLNPSVQVKARKEIEADRAALPYVRSIMTEVLRWQPAAPLGIPHATSQDDIYDGMHIFKGSLVIANIWHMLHDPAVYRNPMDFDPDRYQGLDSEMDKVTDLAFGFGRRACPGKDFAEGTFFAIISTVLATCEILPILDAGGNEVLPKVTYSSGTIVFPSPFNCNIKCRSQKALELLSHGYSTDEPM